MVRKLVLYNLGVEYNFGEVTILNLLFIFMGLLKQLLIYPLSIREMRSLILLCW